MRKNRVLIFISMIMLLFVTTACTITKSGSIYLEGYEDKDSLILLSIGKPEYSNYTVVHKVNDTIETTPLEETMISNYDRMKFYQIGESEITINAFDCECTVKIVVSRNTFASIKLIDSTVTYDGQKHSLEFNKSLPSGTEVTYDIGNSFTDVGEYVITATLINDAYDTYKTTGTLTIEKANYDTSSFSFNDSTVTYDGKYKTLQVTGNLPTGVNVYYSIEGFTSARAINAGTYTVTATFTNTNTNYNDIDPLTATLTITKGTIDVSELLFLDTEIKYDGSPKRIKLIGDIPEGVDVTYDVINSVNGEHLDYRQVTEVGVYYFLASFEVDSTNYETIEPMLAVLTISEE